MDVEQQSPELSLDERQRDEAISSDAALVRYEQKWRRKLTRLQRAHPARWRVPGISEEEVRDQLTLHLIEVLRGDQALHAAFARPGREWGLCVAERRLAELRRRFRIEATPMDFSDAPLLERPLSQEQRFLDAEAELCRSRAAEQAREQLNLAERRWLAAMRLCANAGEFFQSSGVLNLSAASRVLGKHRASAQRAYRALQTHFQRELDELE